MTHLFRTALAAVFLWLCAWSAQSHEYKLGSLEIHHPAARAMLPGAKVGGGFLTILNSGTEDDTLLSISTERAGKTQIHEMKMEDDVMKMREVKEGLPIPAGGTLELKKGDLHIMFMDVATPFAKGESFKATLTFAKAGSIEVNFNVDQDAGDGKAHKHD